MQPDPIAIMQVIKDKTDFAESQFTILVEEHISIQKKIRTWESSGYVIMWVKYEIIDEDTASAVFYRCLMR